jgi:hypothetical protein
VHLSAPAAHEIAVARLGRGALLRPEPDDAADRAEEQLLGRRDYAAAARHDVYPGSYAEARGSAAGRPYTVSAWVRIWHLPATVETSSWSSVVSEMDYPGRCHWALGIDADGHPGCYVGDGEHHDRVWWCFAGSSLLGRLGEWAHLAFTVDGTNVQLWVDGDVAGEGMAADVASSPAAGSAESILRIGAAAESGLTDHFLDGDVSDVALFSRRLTRHEIVALTEDKAMSPVVSVARESLIAHGRCVSAAGPGQPTSAGTAGTPSWLTLPPSTSPGPRRRRRSAVPATTRTATRLAGARSASPPTT